MSTRSIIAVPDTEHGWTGVYHHSDGYPLGLGVYLTRILAALGSVATFRREVIDAHPAGWSALNGKPARCYCHWEGREEKAHLYHGDVPLETDAVWFYLATPEGIVTREIVWREGDDFLADLGAEYANLRDAVVTHDGEEGGDLFDRCEGWAFVAALPDFCTAERRRNMAAQHTAGPWHVDMAHRGDKPAGLRDIRDAEERLLGWAHSQFNGISPAEAEANARLWTAAPELLAALKAMLAPMYGTAAERLHPATAERIRIGRAAVARATEVQP